MNETLLEDASVNHNNHERLQAVRADDLPRASLADLLLFGLALGEEEPAIGVLTSARDDVVLLAELAEHEDGDVPLRAAAPTLERLGRRLDVALELLERQRKERDRTKSTPGY